jgi:HSP20 family protein
MFGLIPSREGRRTQALLPRFEAPFRLWEEFEPVFERFFGTWPTPAEMMEVPGYRGLRLEETEKEYLVRAELPGFEPAEVTVTLLGNVLTIEAKHGEEPKEGEAKERHYAHAKRSVTLPAEAELEKLEATYRNGILEVRLPKAPEAVARRIEVKT